MNINQMIKDTERGCGTAIDWDDEGYPTVGCGEDEYLCPQCEIKVKVLLEIKDMIKGFKKKINKFDDFSNPQKYGLNFYIDRDLLGIDNPTLNKEVTSLTQSLGESHNSANTDRQVEGNETTSVISTNTQTISFLINQTEKEIERFEKIQEEWENEEDNDYSDKRWDNWAIQIAEYRATLKAYEKCKEIIEKLIKYENKKIELAKENEYLTKDEKIIHINCCIDTIIKIKEILGEEKQDE